MNHEDVIQRGKKVVRIETEAVAELENRIDESFKKAVDIIQHTRGRVIITGIGKSGIIAKKIASTLSSTGTAAFFLHPTEGVHGELGMVLKDDVVICVSKSGNTPELAQLIPIFKRLGVSIIAITGNPDSELGRNSDVVLDVSVREEACPFDLAPTASTTAALVMGDALAVALLQLRNFTREDFARVHPGGVIGKKLLLRIDDLMVSGDRIAKVSADTPLKEVVYEITSKRFGATCVVNGDNKLLGIITDGDLRRLLEKRNDVWELCACDIMTPNPKVVKTGTLAIDTINLMKVYAINQIIVVDGQDVPIGMIHIHDLLKAGIV
ncbi:D-arabinose 5-phosphate isomerase [candidate division KSB1 bacterium]|mgnify:FL=1|nr:MAG: D-arabinose 5-phosphate isomerase [candidate division KSB1 bacterium]RKY81099.1 MAG: D-arabinose 5-phosphate isomerase [candidate division KSB1 bacterium]